MVIYDLCQRSHRGFLDPLNSILRSILGSDARRMRRGRFLRKSKLFTPIGGCLEGFPSCWAHFWGLLKYATAHACARENFFAFYSFYRNSVGIQGVFWDAEVVSEVYFSIRLHAHAQERIFTHFKAFNANRWVPRRFFKSLSSFPRST